MIGDGYCDDKYNTDKCNFDGGDCCQPELDSTYCTECICYQRLADVQLDDSSNCDFKSYVANGICEDFANTPSCNYDGGDCCGPSNYAYCGLCQCLFDEYEVLSTESQLNASKCDLFAHAIGDGFCQDEVNTEECNYDGGDCCNPSTAINLCTDCTCKNASLVGKVTGYTVIECPLDLQELTNNGRCDDQANIPECDYDTNECCGAGNYDICDACQCLDPKKVLLPRHIDTSCKYWAVKGNGYCDDVANTFGCDWDGGDCCGDNVRRGKCEVCACLDDTINLAALTTNLQCETGLMFDGQCDLRNRYRECRNDGFDCCLNDLGQVDAELCPSFKICHTHLFENGRCDQANNRASCLFDLGECPSDDQSPVDCVEILKGDGVCDLWNNQDQCDFDAQDCSPANDQELLMVGLGSPNFPSNRFIAYYANGDSVEWIPRFPKYKEEALLFTTSDKTIYICGGKNSDGIHVRTCHMYNYILDDQYTFWTETHSMINSMVHTANIVMFRHEGIYEEYLWVTGGKTGFGVPSSITERLVVTKRGAKWEFHEDLPIAVAGHCIVALEPTKALIAGGYGVDDVMNGETFLFDAHNVRPKIPWTQVGSMRTPRKHHLCQSIVYKGLEVVVALGGFNILEENLNSAEMYYLTNQVWGVGPMQLPRYLTGSSIVKWHGRLHLIGGTQQLKQQKIVWTHHEDYNWRRSSIVLQEGLTRHVSWTLQADEIKQKEHTMILLVGGMLSQNDDPAPLEAFCLQGNEESVFNEFCDSTINTKMFLLNDLGTGLAHFNPYVVKLNENSLLVCGGMLSSAQGNHGPHVLPKQCQKYNSEFQDFTIFRPDEEIGLAEVRNGSAFSYYGGPEVAWITGGFKLRNGLLTPMQSTEIIDTRQEKVEDIIKAGPDLPYALAGHCSVYLGGQLFYFMGGYDSLSLSTKTFVMRITDGFMRFMPALPKAKSYHTCFTVPMNEDLYIMVIGGGSSAIDTFSFKDRSWKSAKDLCDDDHCYR